MLQETADEFETQWNFPNCVGEIGGKHVRTRCPQSSGSQFHNYKSIFSVHLQAIVDAKYKFMTVDVGAYGRQSDSGVFTESSVFRHLEAGSFNLPPPRKIPRTNITLPYVLVGDQ
jgi:DnaJ-class molecular chaperone